MVAWRSVCLGGSFGVRPDEPEENGCRLNTQRPPRTLDHATHALQATYFNGKVIEVALPKQMILEVVETDPGEKGNTAQGATKVTKTHATRGLSCPVHGFGLWSRAERRKLCRSGLLAVCFSFSEVTFWRAVGPGRICDYENGDKRTCT